MMHARRASIFFPEQECNLIPVLVWLNLTLLLKKMCKMHIRVFEIVAHRNVDNCTQSDTINDKMYLGAACRQPIQKV